MTPPPKKHLSTQQKDDQNALESIWLRDVLDRNSISEDVDTPNAHSQTDLQLTLHSLLRNVGSRVRKSVTEGYTTPPASLTPHTSPCKNTSVNLNSSPLKLSSGDSDCLPLPSRRMSGPHGQIFSSSRDILRSVYTGLQDSVNLNALPTFDSSPKKRSRTYSLIEQDEEEGEGKDRIEIDLPATSLPPRNLNRKIKPLPFRLSTTHRLSLPSSVAVAASSVYTTPGSVKPDLGAADDEDPFSPSLPVSRNPTDMETDVDMLRDGVEVL